MKVRFHCWSLLALALPLIGCGSRGEPAVPAVDDVPGTVAPLTPTARMPFLDGLELSGPYRHENLELFLVHRPGEDPPLPGFIALAEGLAAGKVKLAEKSGEGGAQVNTLTITNDSDQPLFLQAGDIVKGGQQDRTLARDMVVPPHASGVELAAFCVESGRWRSRAGKSPDFGLDQVVMGNAPSPAIKRKVLQGDQAGVWAGVESFQLLFGGNAGVPVREGESPTSLALSLEHKEARRVTRAGLSRLEALAALAPDTVGAAWAVGGKVRAVEVYGSPELFRKSWPALVTAAVYEAFAWSHEKGGPPVAPGDFAARLTKVAGGKERRDASGPGVDRVVREFEGAWLAETFHEGRRIHLSYIPEGAGEGEAGRDPGTPVFQEAREPASRPAGR